MSVRRKKPRTVFLLALGFVFVAAVLSLGGQLRGQTSANKSEQKRYVRQTDPSLYVGSETCKTCHEDMPVKGFFKSFEDSPHYVSTLDSKKGPEWHGCEACHGPGKEHVEGGGDKTKIFTFKGASAQEISALPRLPPVWRRAREFRTLRPPAEWRGLHRLPRPAPCQREPVPPESEAAGFVLRLSPGQETAIQPAVPSSRERRLSEMHGLP
jgi:hypothetical protein